MLLRCSGEDVFWPEVHGVSLVDVNETITTLQNKQVLKSRTHESHITLDHKCTRVDIYCISLIQKVERSSYNAAL